MSVVREVVLHPKVDEGDELARRCIIRASAREALEEHAASEAISCHAMKTFEPGTLCFCYQCEDDIWDPRL